MKTFTTDSKFLATYLLASKFELENSEFLPATGICDFHFIHKTGIEEFIRSFHNRTGLTNVRDFIKSLRVINDEIYAHRKKEVPMFRRV